MCDGKELSKNALSDEERKRKEALVKSINKRFESISDEYEKSVKEIKELKDSKLYREYGTWKEFCETELSKSIRHVNRMLQHSEVIKELRLEAKKWTNGPLLEDQSNKISDVVDNLPESATRELSGLTTADKLETIKKASENGKKTPTAKQIKEARAMDEPAETTMANEPRTKETNTIEVDREELDRLKNIESEYEKLKSQKAIKVCPHCRKDTSKQPAKTIHAPQQFDRTQEKKELSEYFA